MAVYTLSAEFGRVMTVNDFFARLDHPRKGIGRELAKHLMEECERMKIDEIGLEVLREKNRSNLLEIGGPTTGRSFSLQKEAE